ncbi:MAG: HD-GYP domain-containing protein [Candidatus Krumholzibacteriota bacterium]|nr:HD-GYP domain-containing protein [Candidatus Krumholzibacteriota bacterium]
MAAVKQKSGAGFKLFYFIYVVAGFLFLAYFIKVLPADHWRDIFLFLILIIIADSAQISLPRGGASIYASSPIDLAGIVLFGPAVMAVIEAVATLITEGIFQRRPIIKVLFNIPLLVMTVGVSGFVYNYFGSLVDLNSPLFLIPLLAAGIVYYLFNTWSVSIVISLDSQRNPLVVWKQNYMWNFFHILAFFPIAAVIALLYRNSGVWTIALFIIPLFLARYSFQLYLDMRETHINTVAALTSAIDASDPFTHGHSYRVSRYALRIAREMGMTTKDMEMLEYAALLHDIGKIAVKNEILLKVGPLTDEEWKSLRAHPQIGAEIVEKLKFLNEAGKVVRAHHERPDGSGYPNGLKEDDIPLAAHILNVVDAFDAMTSDRPYRKALPVERVLEELETYKGRQFHTKVTDLLLDLHNRGDFPIIVEADVTTEIYNSLVEHVQL